MGDSLANPKVTAMIIERDEVIRARREALARWLKIGQPQQETVYREFIQPLNQRLCSLNRELGL